MDLHTPLRSLAFAAIDFESAGAAPGRTDVPVQVGIARWSLREGHHDPFSSYLRSPRPVTWAARRVHGIRDEDLADAPELLQLWPEFKARLAGTVVVAHGKGTEKRFLRAFPGHGFGPWIDTLLLARAAWPELADHSLAALCDALGLVPAVDALAAERRWHDALRDALGSLVVLEHLVRSRELAETPLGGLLAPDTRDWHRRRRG